MRGNCRSYHSHMPMYEFLIQAQAHYDAEQSMPHQGLYRFAYTITITNSGRMAAQIIARHWLITYSSACELRTPQGHMQGRYVCVSEEGETFDAPIALFVLDADHTGDSADAI